MWAHKPHTKNPGRKFGSANGGSSINGSMKQYNHSNSNSTFNHNSNSNNNSFANGNHHSNNHSNGVSWGSNAWHLVLNLPIKKLDQLIVSYSRNALYTFPPRQKGVNGNGSESFQLTSRDFHTVIMFG